MRRRFLHLAVLSLLLTSAFVPPVSASAHGLGARVTVGACKSPSAYPPSPDATVESSTTSPDVGETIEASGIHYCPDEDVRLTIGGKFVGTAHTDAAGGFDPPVVVPGPAGIMQLCGVGASGLATDRDCLTLTVRGAGTSSSPTPAGSGTSNGGGTAFTGVEIAALVAIAALLLGGGLAFATAGRRRPDSVTS